MDLKDWINTAVLLATIAAIIYGPIKAVAITRAADEEREKKRRQYDILHSLMRTRAFTLHADHVAALNLVQLEFYGHKAIDVSFRRYMEHLSSAMPSTNDAADLDRYLDERADRFYTMVQDMAAHLGFVFDKGDLKRLSYAPRGWNDTEARQRGLQEKLIELLDFRRPLPVRQFNASDIDPRFPPPPSTV